MTITACETRNVDNNSDAHRDNSVSEPTAFVKLSISNKNIYRQYKYNTHL